MRSLYSNSDTPFDVLPYHVRWALAEYGVWYPKGPELAAPWQAVQAYRAMTAQQLVPIISAMEKHRAEHPNLYGGNPH